MLEYFIRNWNKQLFFSGIKQVSILIIISRSNESLIFFINKITSKLHAYFLNFVVSWYENFCIWNISAGYKTCWFDFLLNFEKGKVYVFRSFYFKDCLIPQITTKPIMQLI